MGPRRGRPLVALSPAAMRLEEIEARLGPQALIAADGGTLLLDAIGDLPPPLQAQLMRLLDEGGQPVTTPATRRPVDICVVTSATQDLRWRPDRLVPRTPLFPPQRRDPAPRRTGGASRPRARSLGRPASRRPLLAGECARAGESVAPHQRALSGQSDHHRDRRAGAGGILGPPAAEAANALERAVARALTTYLAEAAAERPTALYDHFMKSVEAPLLSSALQATRDNRLRAAELLGINRNTQEAGGPRSPPPADAGRLARGWRAASAGPAADRGLTIPALCRRFQFF